MVTSPPYNIGINYGAYKDNKPYKQYLKWMDKLAKELYRVLKKNGSIFLNMSGTSVNPWIAYDVAQVFRQTFILQNNIIWVKSISIREDTHGHFKPINSHRYLNHNHESLFHFTKTGNVSIDRLSIGVPFKDKSNLTRRGSNTRPDKRCAGDIWFTPYKTVNSKAQKFNHPAGFPEELVARCIQFHGKAGKVLDPFVGTGTTLVIAEQMGYKGIGFDIDKNYIRTAKKRIKQEVSIKG